MKYLLTFFIFSLFFISCNQNIKNTNKQEKISILPKDLKLLINKKKHLNIIDVRSKEEFNSHIGHIKDAKLIPIQTIAKYIEELKQLNEKVYVVCLSGKRSAVAAKILRDNEIIALNLEGGMLAWNKLK